MFDLDGVLADFQGAAVGFHGKIIPYHEIEYDFAVQCGFRDIQDPAFWKPLTFDFWANLPVLADGMELLRKVEAVAGGPDNVALVSSGYFLHGSSMEGVGETHAGKRVWVQRHLPRYEDSLFIGRQKWKLAGRDKLLIDDLEGAVETFHRARGGAVLVPRPWNVKRSETVGGRFEVQRVFDQVMREALR